MLISVIIPLYNKEKYIHNTLKSVTDQTHKDLEIIVIDDGSTDNSANIVLKIPDKRIRYFKKNNGGVSQARNIGLSIADGDWLIFLDADDTLESDSIEKLLNLSIKFPEAEVCCGNYKCVRHAKSVYACKLQVNDGYINNPSKLQFYKLWNLRLGSFILNKKLYKQIKFNEQIKLGEDVLYTDQLLNFKIAYSNFNTMCYNLVNSFYSTYKVKIEYTYTWNVNMSNLFFYKKLQVIELFVVALIKLTLRREIYEAIKLLKHNINYFPRILTYLPMYLFKFLNIIIYIICQQYLNLLHSHH
jgi:glycosyltransferase involved in cell wall biosynthesis